MQKILQKLQIFRDERNWKQYHNIKNLLIALQIEVSESQELFLWKNNNDIILDLQNLEILEKFEDELSDIFIYLLNIYNILEYDESKIIQLIFRKIEKNRKKYSIS